MLCWGPAAQKPHTHALTHPYSFSLSLKLTLTHTAACHTQCQLQIEFICWRQILTWQTHFYFILFAFLFHSLLKLCTLPISSVYLPLFHSIFFFIFCNFYFASSLLWLRAATKPLSVLLPLLYPHLLFLPVPDVSFAYFLLLLAPRRWRACGSNDILISNGEMK